MLLRPTIPYLSLSYTIIAIATILNSLEIRLIVRKIKTATDFEIVLLNLAIADLLNSVLFTAVLVLTQHYPNGKQMNHDAFYWVMGILAFSVIASVSFVIIIGLERFFAIKVPLQHRLWHTSRRKLVTFTVLTWLLDVVLIAAVIMIDHFKTGRSRTLVSSRMIYFLAGLLTLGMALIFVLYTWVLYLMILRSIKLFDFDKNILRINPKMIKDAMKKERSSIIICTLVVLSFMACNIPLVVDLFQFQVTMTTAVLLNFTAVANPLIYFFKGYLEKYYAKQKLPSPPDQLGCTLVKGKAGHGSQEKTEESRNSNKMVCLNQTACRDRNFIENSIEGSKNTGSS